MTLKLVLIMAASVLIISAAAQQTPMNAPMISPEAEPAPGPDCLTAVRNVSDCLSYVLKGSNLTVPDKPCCPEFAGFLESNPICLCQLIVDPDTLGIDLSRALMLPSFCKLTLPPLSSCPGSTATTPSPSPTFGDGPASSAGTSPEGEATSNPPSTNGQNVAPSITLSRSLTLGCSAATCFAAFLI